MLRTVLAQAAQSHDDIHILACDSKAKALELYEAQYTRHSTLVWCSNVLRLLMALARQRHREMQLLHRGRSRVSSRLTSPDRAEVKLRLCDVSLILVAPVAGGSTSSYHV